MTLSQRILRRISGYEDDLKVQNILQKVNEYHSRLSEQGLWQSQERNAILSKDWALAFLIFQIFKFLLASLLTVPGLILFSPVLVMSNEVSKSKAREALAKSPFKAEGRDVLASWKALIALTVSPILYLFYSAVWAYLAYRYRTSLSSAEIIASSGIVVLPAITLASMYTGDCALITLRSFRSLLMLLHSGHARTLEELYEMQCRLTAEVKHFIDSPHLVDQKI
jgi:glycerol-3-phosphate O-acyltransferase/dihydroxyacetone phosphate acyltransferase